MSYPQPAYHGDGDALASYRSGSALPELVYGNGTRCHFLIRGDATRGLFGLYRWEMSAEKSGPGPHFHRSITESFYVLAGTVRIYDGRRWLEASVGDFVHVPEGGVHGFRNESGEPASMLIHFAPGAPREDYFAGTARMSRGARLTDEQQADFYVKHDTYWVDRDGS